MYSHWDSSLASILTLMSSVMFWFSELFSTLLSPPTSLETVAKDDFSASSVDWLLDFELFPADIPCRYLQRPDERQRHLPQCICMYVYPSLYSHQHPQNHRLALMDAGPHLVPDTATLK